MVLEDAAGCKAECSDVCGSITARGSGPWELVADVGKEAWAAFWEPRPSLGGRGGGGWMAVESWVRGSVTVAGAAASLHGLPSQIPARAF